MLIISEAHGEAHFVKKKTFRGGGDSLRVKAPALEEGRLEWRSSEPTLKLSKHASLPAIPALGKMEAGDPHNKLTA